MKKRIISLLLALSMMISLVPVSALANTGGGTTPLAAGDDLGQELVMNANGVPDTSNMRPDAEGVYHGNNWTYGPGGRYGRLTLTSGEWDFSKTKPADGSGVTLSAVNCIVQINDGATVKGGTFNIVVNTGNSEQNIKGGTIAGGTFKSSVNNCGGTIKNGEFTHCVNDNLGDAKGTIEGGTFASNGTSDSVTNYGIISGGIFNGLVTSYWKGVIEKGTFNGIVSNDGSISGGYFLSADNKYDTASKVSGGVFKTIPSTVENTSNLYKIQFDSESGADTTNTLSVDNHDFGMTSVYVVGKDDTELTVTAKDKILTSVNNKANTTANSNSITFKPGEVKLDDEKEGNAYLLKLNAKIYNGELVIGTDGKPVTEGRKPYGDNGVKGNGWTYNTKTETLTILTGHTERFAGFDVNNQLKVNVVVQKGATVERGQFYKTVENHGTMSRAFFYGNVTNTGDGTMNKCTFSDSNFTGNLTITNEGEMEECIVAKDVTMLTNNGKMIRSSVGAITVQGNGTYDTCLLAKNYEIAGTHKVTTKNETDKIMVRLVNDDGIQYYAVVEETEVYFTGTPRLKVQIDDGWTRIPLTNVNGDENYEITLKNNYYIFAVPANSDVILNDTVKHTLTVKDGTIKVGEEAKESPATLAEDTVVTVTASAPESGKYFAGWTVSDGVTLKGADGEGIDLTDKTLTFQMPTSNVTLTATYEAYETKLEIDKTTDEPVTTNREPVYEDGKVVGYKGDGWTYINGTLTLSGTFEFAEDDYTRIDCSVIVGSGAKLSNAAVVGSDATVTNNGTIANCYFGNPSVTVINNGEIRNSIFATKPNGTGTLSGCLFASNEGLTDCWTVDLKYSNGKTAYAGLQNNPFEMPVNEFYVIADASGTLPTITLSENPYNGPLPAQVTVTAPDGAWWKQEINNNSLTIVQPTYKLTLVDAELVEMTGNEFTENATIKLTAKNAAEGKEFDKWELSEGLTLVDGYKLTDATIKIKMPGKEATAKATYKNKTVPSTPGGDDDQPKTYTVTVKGGTINNKTEEKAKKGTKLTVDVDEKEVPEGMTFDVWSISFPEGVKDTLTGDPSVKLHDPHMDFAMPGADITIEAQYRSSELPGEDDGPSTLGTMATVAVGGAAAGILVWQGVSLGVDSYLQLNLPKGVAVPANRRELVVLLWETAGKPEAALPSLYSDVPAEEIELQKATRWAIDNGLVKPADDSDASRFDPDRYVTKYDVFGAWLKLKKLMK